MGTVISAALVLLLAGAVFLAVRSIRRRKGCGAALFSESRAGLSMLYPNVCQ